MNSEISIVDTGKQKIIVKLPHDMMVLSTWSAKWKFKFGGSSFESYPIRMPDGKILLDKNPNKLVATPGAMPMAYLILRVFDQAATRTSASKKKPKELIAVCGLDGSAFICSITTVHADTRELHPRSDEFKIADIIGDDDFGRITKDMRSFLLREKQ